MRKMKLVCEGLNVSGEIMDNTGNTYIGLNGQKYTLESKLGSGGEGDVYSILNNSLQVAKIFKVNKPGREDKLKATINLKIPSRINGIVRLALPEDILYKNGRMVGFVMPFVDDTLRLFKVCREKDKDKDAAFPDYGWKHGVIIAYNFAELIEYLHSKGVIIGDFNPNNFVVDGKHGGLAVFVDCDSFDIRDPKSGKRFPCEVAFPEVAAPEIQNVKSFSGRHTVESDNFSLAMHIFRLLMNNMDPFNAIDVGVQRNSSSSAGVGNLAIVKGECPYVRNLPHKRIPHGTLPFEFLPSDIRELFRRVFNYNEVTAVNKKVIKNRPTAGEWAKTLRKYATDDRYITTCTVNPLHKYPNHNTECPWCKLDRERMQGQINRVNSKVSTTIGAPVGIQISSQNTQSTQNTQQIQSNANNNSSKNGAGFLVRTIGIILVFIVFFFVGINIGKSVENERGRNIVEEKTGHTNEYTPSTSTVSEETQKPVATATLIPTSTPIPTPTPTPTPVPTDVPVPQETYDTELTVVKGIIDPSTGEEIFIPGATVSSYLWPDAANREYSKSDLDGLTEGQARYLINEIYAREGYTFKNELWQEYFEQKTWYEATIPNEVFSEDPKRYLNPYEAWNVDMISSYQHEHNYVDYTR